MKLQNRDTAMSRCLRAFHNPDEALAFFQLATSCQKQPHCHNGFPVARARLQAQRSGARLANGLYHVLLIAGECPSEFTLYSFT